MIFRVKNLLNLLNFQLFLFCTFCFWSLFAYADEESCIDYENYTIQHGRHYIPGPNVCSVCVCYHNEPKWCRAIYCKDAPYDKCKLFVSGPHCCELICLDGKVNESNWDPSINYIGPLPFGDAANITSSQPKIRPRNFEFYFFPLVIYFLSNM